MARLTGLVMLAALGLSPNLVAGAFAQSPPQTQPNEGLRSPEHNAYLQSGSAILRGKAYFLDRARALASNCSEINEVYLLPDTPYFRAQMEASLSGRSSASSEDDRRLLSMLVRVATCNDKSEFEFQNLPPLPYMAFTHLVVILGSYERDLLEHVAPEASQTTEIVLNEGTVIQPGRVGVGAPPPPPVTLGPLDRLTKYYAALYVRDPDRIQGELAQSALNALRDHNYLETARRTRDYIQICIASQQCSREILQDVVDGFDRNQNWLELFAFLATLGASPEATLAVRATETDLVLEKAGVAFTEAVGVRVRPVVFRVTEAAAPSAVPGKLLGNLEHLDPAERTIADWLVARGHQVEIVPPGAQRTADYLVDGVPTELKTVQGVVNQSETGLSGALASRIMDARGQSGTILVSAVDQAGMTPEIAKRGILRALGADTAKGSKIESITVLTKDGIVRWPPAK